MPARRMSEFDDAVMRPSRMRHLAGLFVASEDLACSGFPNITTSACTGRALCVVEISAIASITTLTTTHYAIRSLIWIAIFCAVASSFRSDRFHFFANNPDVGSRIATSNPKDAVGRSRGR
jgi:hypothetical protein